MILAVSTSTSCSRSNVTAVEERGPRQNNSRIGSSRCLHVVTTVEFLEIVPEQCIRATNDFAYIYSSHIFSVISCTRLVFLGTLVSFLYLASLTTQMFVQEYPVVGNTIVNAIVRLEAQKYTLELLHKVWTEKAT